jgi:hypothetical protein
MFTLRERKKRDWKLWKAGVGGEGQKVGALLLLRLVGSGPVEIRGRQAVYKRVNIEL